MSTEIIVAQNLLPQTFAEVQQMAHEMASAKLVPSWFQKSPGDCALLIRLAIHWQCDPTLLSQETYLISGRLMPSGKLAAAIINSRGGLAERLRYEFNGAGDDRTVTAFGRLASESTPREITLKLKDVRTENTLWKKQPDQQLCYAAARTWGRRHVPELLLGVTFVEEADAIPIAPRPVNELPRIQTPPASTEQTIEFHDEVVDPDTGEVINLNEPHKIEGKTWADFVEPMTRAILNCQNKGEYNKWMSANAEMIAKMKEAKPELFKLFDRNISTRYMELSK
jgi:hypothetical protein